MACQDARRGQLTAQGSVRESLHDDDSQSLLPGHGILRTESRQLTGDQAESSSAT